MQGTHIEGCKLVKKCPKVLGTASTAWAGGTGYDPRFQAVWSSDGINMELRGIKACNPICRGTAVRVLGATSRVSGLAVNDSRSRLFQLETIPGTFAIVTYNIRSPKKDCFVRTAACKANTLTQRGLATGLAYDETRDVIYIATSEATSTGFAHFILVVRAASPCKIVCKWQIPGTCLTSKTIVTGLAYDDCTSPMLYVTNGINHLEVAVGSATSCSFKAGKCCTASGRYRGLALIPGWTIRHVGKPCLTKPCLNCNQMHMSTFGGDPSLGNPAFGVELVQAPAGSLAGMFLRIGGCNAGFPYLCGSFHAFPFHAGPIILPITGSGCNGRAAINLPVPANNVFCGLRICFQSIVVCPKGGSGVSDAIDFVITQS